MTHSLFIQYLDSNQGRALALRNTSGRFIRLDGYRTLYELASAAANAGRTLKDLVANQAHGPEVDIELVAREQRLLPPIDHPEPARLYVTGTGLTHLGSAAGRDSMHRKLEESAEATDSMKMFQMGMKGGKPANGEIGVQPEWFYKGNGHCIVPSEGSLQSPWFAEDGGEEPEIAGIYLISSDGTPLRLGFCLANEFSDHVIERGNYLWLAHSKLRPIALGAELLVGDLPGDVHGTSRILRNGEVLWEKPFVSGEENMSHSIANLEHHHFKYDVFRKPGDLHVHVFGTATLSFSDGIRTQEGDVFEIEAEPFSLPLRNRLTRAPEERVTVRPI